MNPFLDIKSKPHQPSSWPPDPPLETLTIDYADYSDHTGESLDDLLKCIKELGGTDVTLDRDFVSQEGWRITFVVPNERYEEELKQHEQRVKQHEEDLDTYEERLKAWMLQEGQRLIHEASKP